MILFQQYCALDAATNDEMRKGCHLIVNSLETRGDNITARFGTESELITGTRRFIFTFLLPVMLSPAICETPLVDRYSRIPTNIFSDEQQSLDACLPIGWIFGLTAGALQRQGAAQARRRLLRARAPNSSAKPLRILMA